MTDKASVQMLEHGRRQRPSPPSSLLLRDAAAELCVAARQQCADV